MNTRQDLLKEIRQLRLLIERKDRKIDSLELDIRCAEVIISGFRKRICEGWVNEG